MPGYDRSGPMGNGAMTGGRRGICGQGKSGIGVGVNVGYGRGMGCGRGLGNGRGICYGGRGMGRGFAGMQRFAPSAVEPANEINMLKAEAASMKNSLDLTTRRIAELENITARPEVKAKSDKE